MINKKSYKCQNVKMTGKNCLRIGQKFGWIKKAQSSIDLQSFLNSGSNQNSDKAHYVGKLKSDPNKGVYVKRGKLYTIDMNTDLVEEYNNSWSLVEPANLLVPGGGGTEETNHQGLLYVWNPAEKRHCWLDVRQDIEISDEEANMRMGTFANKSSKLVKRSQIMEPSPSAVSDVKIFLDYEDLKEFMNSNSLSKVTSGKREIYYNPSDGSNWQLLRKQNGTFEMVRVSGNEIEQIKNDNPGEIDGSYLQKQLSDKNIGEVISSLDEIVINAANDPEAIKRLMKIRQQRQQKFSDPEQEFQLVQKRIQEDQLRERLQGQHSEHDKMLESVKRIKERLLNETGQASGPSKPDWLSGKTEQRKPTINWLKNDPITTTR